MDHNRTIIDELSENFMILIPLLQNKIFDLISPDEVPSIKLSPAAGRVLVLLHEVRCVSVSDLSLRLNILRPNMTPLLDKLVRLELASRKVCEEDRRVILMSISEKGDWLCNEYQRIVSGKVKMMLSDLADSDLHNLLVHMTKIKAILLK